jgi:hypothetical protein
MARGATLLLVIGSSVRFFGHTSGSDAAATWIFVGAIAIGVIGIVVSATATWRKHSRTTDPADSDAG